MFLEVCKLCLLVNLTNEGVDENGETMDDFFRLNLKNWKWHEIDCSADIPPPLQDHLGVVFGNTMIILGGDTLEDDDLERNENQYEYSFSKDKWVEAKKTINSPKLGNVTAAVASEDRRSIIVVEQTGNNINLYEYCKIYELDGLYELLAQEMLCDASFLVDGKTFKVHKCIMAQSKALIKVIEKKAWNNVLNGISAEAFENVLEYLYRRKTKISGSTIVDVLKFAEQYGISGLTDYCCQNFNEDLVLKALKFASENKLISLKSRCFKYVQQNKDIIQNSKDLKTLPQELLLELFQIVASDSLSEHEEPDTKKEDSLYSFTSILRRDESLADITLISNDNVRFKAHKAILCAHSKFFLKMLQTTFQESKLEEFIIHEASGESLKLILDYIYTSSVSLPDNIYILFDLIRTCEYLVLKHLRTMATSKLISQISPQNAFEIFQFSYNYNLEDLKSLAMDALIDMYSVQDLKRVMQDSFKQICDLKQQLRSYIESAKENNEKKDSDYYKKLLDQQHEQYKLQLKNLENKQKEQEERYNKQLALMNSQHQKQLKEFDNRIAELRELLIPLHSDIKRLSTPELKNYKHKKSKKK